MLETEEATARVQLNDVHCVSREPRHLVLADDVTRSAGFQDREAVRAGPAWSRGDLLGRYVIRRMLGRGGMGEVVAALDPELDREVAIKLLRFDGFDLEERRDARSRLAQEAQALARLSHPNIVAVFDVRDGDELAVVMELVAGSSLKEWMKTPHPWRQTVRLFIQAGEGLAAAHAVGIVHRDFKPANVLLDAHECPKVADFGLARVSDGGNVTGSVSLSASHDTSSRADSLLMGGLTATGLVLGTPAYMAPEQHLGAIIDERADQFAFCVALYEAVYGRHPFRTSSIYAELKAAVVEGRVIPPPSGTAPRRLWKVLARGLQADVTARYPSMAELLLDLEALQGRRGMLRGFIGAPVALVGAAWLFQDVDNTACGAGDDLQTTWSRDALPNIERAFASSSPAGLARWQHLAPQLDAYVSSWRSMYDGICTDSTMDPVERDAVLACLQSARRRLVAASNVLAAADATTVLRASDVVGNLVPAAQCRDVGKRSEWIDEGEDDAVSQRVADVEALYYAGQYEQSLRLGRSLLAEIPNRLLRTRAKVSFFLASSLDALGKWNEAVPEFENSFHLASSADAPALANRVAVGLAYHYVADHKEVEPAEVWARHASAARERARLTHGAEDPAIEARTLRLAGRLAHERGLYERAIAPYQKSLEVEPKGAHVPTTWQLLGELLFRLGRYEEAEAAYQAAVEELEAASGNHHPDLGTALNNLGATQMTSGKLDAAHGSFQRAIGVWEASFGPDDYRLRFAFSNLGWIADARGRFADSRTFYERAVQLRNPQADPNHVENALMHGGLARAYRRLEQWDLCLETAERGLAILQASGATETFYALVLLPALSFCHTALGHPDRGVEYAARSIDLFDKLFGPNFPEVAESQQALGRALLALDRPGEAAERFRLFLRFAGEAQPAHVLAEAEFDLAQALIKLPGGETEALEHAEKAWTRYESLDSHAVRVNEIGRWLMKHRSGAR